MSESDTPAVRTYTFSAVGQYETIDAYLTAISAKYTVSDIIRPTKNQARFKIHNLPIGTASSVVIEAIKSYSIKQMNYVNN